MTTILGRLFRKGEQVDTPVSPELLIDEPPRNVEDINLPARLDAWFAQEYQSLDQYMSDSVLSDQEADDLHVKRATLVEAHRRLLKAIQVDPLDMSESVTRALTQGSAEADHRPQQEAWRVARALASYAVSGLEPPVIR